MRPVWTPARTGAPPATRWPYGLEVVLLLLVSLGRSAVYSVLAIIDLSTRPGGVGKQTSELNPTIIPDRAWLDAMYQVVQTVLPLVPVLLAVLLLSRDHARPWSAIGMDLRRRTWRRDLLGGLALAAAIGVPGLGLYLAARAAGLNTEVSAAGVGTGLWAIGLLVARALMNGVVEEVLVVGYLVDRLRRIGWSLPVVLACSALLRGAYHLYQGWGAFAGNMVMGVVFGLVYLRWRRVMPLVVAHTVIDIVAFVGYAVLAPRVGWI
ncbi:CAAX protease self-immunity [Raineyella antarctica]|uniref:CAAX protease self-immunity n=1 Tax=Raineyella antarctica TaxID=1577474 RepID=A0A1G6GGC4_9ACTN|nr:CPBP family intramembrane glutamic endopeptidase [Raineyella antarctica]SDB80226.1 CAAX protease self-immunity [Raineyella antarctica]